MKKNKLISVVMIFLVSTFFFVMLFPNFKTQAGTLGSTYLFLSRIKAGLNGQTNNEVEMVLAVTPSQAFAEAKNLEIEILFPKSDNTNWCRNAGALTVTGVATGAPDVTGYDITTALPVKAASTLAATCAIGSGATTDRITITNVGSLTSGTTYGVKVSNGTGRLGTAATSGSKTITIQVSDDDNLDSKAFGVYLIAEDTVQVSATVTAAPTINCTVAPTTVSIGTLFPGGALVTKEEATQISTSSTNSGYYWAVYGKGNGTTAGLYNSTGAGYTLNSGATTVDLSGSDTKGFGLVVSTTPSGATTAANFQVTAPTTFGGIVANATGAKLLLYKTTPTAPAHSAGITYGARADSAALAGTYNEYVTYVCGGYY